MFNDDLWHREVGWVSCGQAAFDPMGGRSNETVGLMQSHAIRRVLAAPSSRGCSDQSVNRRKPESVNKLPGKFLLTGA